MKELLEVIEGRRSVLRFKPDPIPNADLEKILEAGRWAPSYANSQPWKFIVVRDPERRRALGALVERILVFRPGRVALSSPGVGEAPVVIAVVVDPARSPLHHLEAGAAAAQNMALMAHVLGYGSFWAGVAGRGEVEREIKRILRVPRGMRVVALLPLGKPAYEPEPGQRFPLAEIVVQEQMG
ncbi:MAG: nitroreductase family protein [Candidatus Bipolaricaulota bacterium]|nr:nitroreductase family protein [Candidatus Bipolaricaulota bacterium]MDW8126532.1 nitroreductase family protein [Candidatus Bipolaricaulota bacterium]